MTNDRTGKVEGNRVFFHVGTQPVWLKRGVVRSDLYPPPLWVQFAMLPVYALGWLLYWPLIWFGFLIDCVARAVIKLGNPRCPRCRRRLRTRLSQQCFHCGSDWHKAGSSD